MISIWFLLNSEYPSVGNNPQRASTTSPGTPEGPQAGKVRLGVDHSQHNSQHCQQFVPPVNVHATLRTPTAGAFVPAELATPDPTPIHL